MSKESEILDKLQGIFESVFDRNDLKITPETNAFLIEGWDSFMHITLIVSIEEGFGISFTTEEIGAFNCVRDVVDSIALKI